MAANSQPRPLQPLSSHRGQQLHQEQQQEGPQPHPQPHQQQQQQEQPPPQLQPPRQTRHCHANWTHAETLSLVQLYREKAAIIKGNFSDNGCSAEAKEKAWGSIVSRLAALHPGFSRCIKQCQRRWQTVMQEAKAKISAYQKARNGTGGGLPPTPLGELEVIIADVLGEGNVSVNSIDRTVVDPFPLDTEDVPENGWVNKTLVMYKYLQSPYMPKCCPSKVLSDSPPLPPITTSHLHHVPLLPMTLIRAM